MHRHTELISLEQTSECCRDRCRELHWLTRNGVGEAEHVCVQA